MGLLRKYLLEAIGRMERDRVKMHFFGDLSPLSEELRVLCMETEEISKRYEGCQVNICLNYGAVSYTHLLAQSDIKGVSHVSERTRSFWTRASW